ncbi:hypothetical protein [Streptomyces sp. NPDC006997]|uniref:hypothetical protein n=1 Tax=Streptomyces sp. NPDC006997 TaxID=3155356 RepID=UPI00340EBF50
MEDANQLAELRTRADAGDRDAAGRLGELLARRGDDEEALRVWARAYGDESPTTRRLAELLAERGDLAGAVDVWRCSDPVWQNPAGLHAEHLDTLDAEDRLDDDDPEDRAFTEGQQLARLLAERESEGEREREREHEHEREREDGDAAEGPSAG